MTNMDYKSFYRHLLHEEYPLGGYDMSQSEADILNTNITDENIFKMMAMAKHDAKKPLAKPRPNAPPRPSLKITPEPKVYTVPTTVSTLSSDEFREMLARRNKPEVEEGLAQDAAKSIRDFMRVRAAMGKYRGHAGDKTGAGGHGEVAKFQRKLHLAKASGAFTPKTDSTVKEETHTLQEWVEILSRASE